MSSFNLNNDLIERRKSQLSLILNWSKQANAMNDGALFNKHHQLNDTQSFNEASLSTSTEIKQDLDIENKEEKLSFSNFIPIDNDDLSASLFDSLNDCSSYNCKVN